MSTAFAPLGLVCKGKMQTGLFVCSASPNLWLNLILEHFGLMPCCSLRARHVLATFASLHCLTGSNVDSENRHQPASPCPVSFLDNRFGRGWISAVEAAAWREPGIPKSEHALCQQGLLLPRACADCKVFLLSCEIGFMRVLSPA